MSSEEISLDGETQGITKKILVAAPEGAESPESEDQVTVHYTGRLLDGTKFDSSVDRNEPFKFKLGVGQVIKGWDVGVASMKKGEKAILTCKPEYAYGKSGSPPKIPGNATLQFEVELISWESAGGLTPDGGIVRKTLKKGTGAKPSAGYEVSVHYVASLAEGGKVFDSSRDRNQRLTFIVGNDPNLPSLFHKTVPRMAVGDIFRVTVKPKYAFGEAGNAQLGVPPNATVIYEIELLESVEIETLHDGVTKKKLKAGDEDSYAYPKDGDAVSIKLTGSLADGKQLWTIDAPTKFVLGSGELPEAVEMALPKMVEGELARVSVANSELLFSAEENQKRNIPTGAHSFVFDVELLGFDKAKDVFGMSFSEKLETSKQAKDIGNQFFKGGRYRQALSKYKKALSLVDADPKSSEEEKKQANEHKLSLFLNLAAVLLKTHDYKGVIDNCKKVLGLDPNSVKALFRQAQAEFHLSFFEEARANLNRAAQLSPQDKEIRQFLATVNQKIKTITEKERKAFSNMFASD